MQRSLMLAAMDSQPAMPRLPAWFGAALLLSLGIHLLIVSYLHLAPKPGLPPATQETVLRLPPMSPAVPQPQTVSSRPPEPVTTVDRTGRTETTAPLPQARPDSTDTEVPQAAPTEVSAGPTLSPTELRNQLRRQTQADYGAEAEAQPGANSVWRDEGGYTLPGSVQADNVFNGRMHGVTGLSGIQEVENYRDLNGFDQKVIKLKDGTRLCGERQPPPNFEPFATSIFTWKKC